MGVKFNLILFVILSLVLVIVNTANANGKGKKFTLGRFLSAPGPSTGQVVGEKIDREIARIVR